MTLLPQSTSGPTAGRNRIRLILFDVDRTLLSAGDLSRDAFLAVFEKIAGREAEVRDYSLAGKTDPQIMTELLVLNGWAPADAQAVLPRALALYQADYLADLPQARVAAMPCARELVARLAARTAGDAAEAGPALGILTGNLEPLVAPKLAAAGMSPTIFTRGGYGSDHADRNRLPAIAARRAERALGVSIRPHEVVIVGDTPRDVSCANRYGAWAVAVATGDYTYEELKRSGPACVLTSLCDWDQARSIVAGL